MAEQSINLDTFINLHQQQFHSIRLPNNLWNVLYSKLFPKRIYDTANAFELHEDEELSWGKWSLHARKNLVKESDVFLIEHAWTSDGGKQAKNMLQKNTALFLKMKDLVLREDEEDEGKYLDKCMVVAELSNADSSVAEEALQHTKGEIIDALSIINDGKVDISSENAINKTLEDKMKTDIISFDEFKAAFLEECENKDVSDEYIKKLYQNYLKEKESESEGDEKEKNGGTTLNYTWSEDVDGTITTYVTIPIKCKKADIVSKITPTTWEFGIKGASPLIKGQFFSRVHPDECFWTFDSPGLMQVLIQKQDAKVSWPDLIKGEEQLSTRKIVAKAHDKEVETCYQIEQILDTMWKYNQTYQAVVSSSGVQESVWYVMDEFGSAVVHSTQPNLRCMPFACVTTGVFYSLIWPMRDVQKNDVCTRNACPQMQTETVLQHQARMLAFEPILPEKCPLEFILTSLELEKASESISPPVVYVQQFAENCENKFDGVPQGGLKFYTDLQTEFFIPSLKDLGFSLVSSPKEADVLWVASESPSLANLQNQKVNRLEGEESLLKKNILSYCIRMKLGKPSWYPVAYDLKSQLAGVVSDHYERGIDNYWIVRSFNRKLVDFKPVVTSNLSRLCRLSEMHPLVASHYNSTTALYNLKRKFCLQFCVIITRVTPVCILLHNTPLIKLTESEIDPFSKPDEYDPVALVATVQGKSSVQVKLDDLLENLNKNYFLRLQHTWEEVRNNIAKAIGELFHVVCPTLIGNTSSHGVYGIDILLAGDLKPLIIGVDEVPGFANQTVLKDVLQVCFSSCENKEKLECAKNFTKITV